MGTILDKASVHKFRDTLRGVLIEPSDAGYDDARKVWNGMIEKHPALIVRCADESDVIASINFARTERLPIAVRGGGHNVAGFGTCDDGILIDLSPMKKIEVAPAARTAQAQAGLTWGRVR
jgi:FAD/FMN-containing dehydrogenase